jgi:predicted negative regulator of RcsB-dependent stress response
VRRHPKNSNAGVSAGSLLALLLAATLMAQEPLAPKAPLAQENGSESGAKHTMTLAAAQRAQDFGLPSVAAVIYRSLLAEPGGDRTALSLALVTALLDSGQTAEAEQVLAEMPEPHGAAWRLRSGLAMLQRGRRAEAQARWDSIREDEVPPADRPWYWFFMGVLYDTATPRDVTRANGAYRKAEAEAATELAEARFQLAGELARLEQIERPSPESVELAKRNFEQSLRGGTAYNYAEQYAAKLSMVDRRADAVQFLQREVLLGLPRHETAWRDKFNFLLGLIGNRGKGGPGRTALIQLLETGLDPAPAVLPADREAKERKAQRQRQALQLLMESSRVEPERTEFKNELGRLLASRTPHLVQESLLFFRAQLSLSDKMYIQADEDANTLLRLYPLSSLRVHARVILTQAAWEQGRYRAAANHAGLARAEMMPQSGAAGGSGAAKPPPIAMSPRLRANLGVLEAEARFRAKDYRNAADTYAAVLLERSPELETKRVGELMFLHVLAEIKAGGDATTVLDMHERDPAFDVDHRWQAEWSLAQALQVKGLEGASEAYRRIGTLLRESEGNAAIAPDLRAKMAWLHARMAFDAGNSAETIRLVDEQIGSLGKIDATLRNEISSMLLLFKAQSEFALNREAAALETLKRLRTEYATNEAAVQSHLIEAEHFAAQDKIDEARNRLIALTDNPAYKDSPYKPLALYRLALLSERLGREENLLEANQRIEDLIKAMAGAADPVLYFAARMRQGDILRKLNYFPRAQAAYEDLVNRYAQRPDVVLAQLALADCHSGQSSSVDAAGANLHSDTARLGYEQLLDRVDAPRDVRVEAGYKLGLLLVQRGQLENAVKVWWTDVVHRFLVKETAPMESDAKRPYWLARALLELGELEEKRGRFNEAKAAYVMVLESRLPFGTVAAARLQQLGVGAPKAGQ